MAWQVKSGCAEHHRAAVQRIANPFPVPWFLAPCTGEVFDNLGHYNRRLRAWAFVEGFDIVRNGGDTTANPSYRFRCIFHGIVTITLAIRSPGQPRQRPLARGPLAAGTPILRLFPVKLSAPSASTAPLRLAEEARWSKAEERAHREVREVCRGRRTRRITIRKD
jgi:hypothetical protein